MSKLSSVWLGGVLVVSSLCCGGRNHLQREGSYSIRLSEFIRDECELNRTLGNMWNGGFQIAGDRAWFRMRDHLFDIEMVGFYLANTEQFALDGSAGNITTVANQRECLIDLVTTHFDGITDNLNQFHGTSRVRYESTNPSCVCQLWARYEATHD